MKRLTTAAMLSGLLFVGAARADDRARLENVRMEWQNAYGAILYTVLADVKNTGAAPLQYVKVKVELFDKNGAAVAGRVGYNVGAEILGDDGGVVDAGKLQKVKPIAPGGSDLVRISLDKTDIGKPFRRTQVTIVEAR